MENITVYGDYEFHLNKYPRKNTEKELTDIIIIIFLMHEEYLKKLALSFDNAIKFHNECKEYFYTFKFGKELKIYNSKHILYFRENPPLRNLHYMDQIYYYYLKNKNFYMNLFESIENAKKAHFERRELSYRIIPPSDFYDKTNSQTYSAIELMEINSYTQYLINNKIIKELPYPKNLVFV